MLALMRPLVWLAMISVLAAAWLLRPTDSVPRSTSGTIQPPTTQPSPEVEDNPHVSPGKVRWHASFAAAQAAAQHSGKPILLFQMMGRLDRQFC